MRTRLVYLPLLAAALFNVTACQTATPPPAKQAQAVVSPNPPATSSSAPAPAIESKPVSAEAARSIANNCYTCHGPNGRSPGTIPSLSRLSAERIATKLKDFKSGAEPSTVMGRHAKAYTDAELEAVAKYIADAGK